MGGGEALAGVAISDVYRATESLPVEQVERFTALCGASIPPPLHAAMEVRRDDYLEGAFQFTLTSTATVSTFTALSQAVSASMNASSSTSGTWPRSRRSTWR